MVKESLDDYNLSRMMKESLDDYNLSRMMKESLMTATPKDDDLLPVDQSAYVKNVVEM